MISKLGDVEEEADETLYWMELLIDAELITATKLNPLMGEVREILAMTVTSIQTLRSRSRAERPKKVAKNEKTPIQNPKSKIQN